MKKINVYYKAYKVYGIIIIIIFFLNDILVYNLFNCIKKQLKVRLLTINILIILSIMILK